MRQIHENNGTKSKTMLLSELYIVWGSNGSVSEQLSKFLSQHLQHELDTGDFPGCGTILQKVFLRLL